MQQPRPKKGLEEVFRPLSNGLFQPYGKPYGSIGVLVKDILEQLVEEGKE